MSGEIHPLKDNQLLAVNPQDSVWLSASAGTGKTQVLSARVLRLLLQPRTSPSEILCLTFTKAGAAEMATRVNEVLARWVRMDDASLAIDLKAIGARVDEPTLARARTLFASVLDCPGGGLRIDTIHAFAQWLLAAFPEEAGLQPGARAMEDRDRDLLAHEVLAAMLVEAEQRGDTAFLDRLAALSLAMGADGARRWLMRCAAAREAWAGPNGWQPPMDGRVRQLLGMPADAGEEWLATFCTAPAFDDAALHACLAGYQGWKGKTADHACAIIPMWLALDAAGRLAQVDVLADALFFKNGNARLPKDPDPAFEGASAAVGLCLRAVTQARRLLELAEVLTPALEIGRRFALAWEEAKAREGFVDFDDQIREAARLLDDAAMADWIRYKLDRRFDHVLVDEAQDTNAAQWSIIEALTGDFFTGQGQHDDLLRTIFVVGDYKQAIFGFQGTSPENFEMAKERFKRAIAGAAENLRDLPHATEPRDLRELDLGRSFRTAQPVLDFVNRAIEAVGHEAIGLKEPPERHVGDDRAGLVTLWEPVRAAAEDDGAEESDAPDSWLPAPERLMADRIAEQVRQWLAEGFVLEKGKRRHARAGDIMVLVRKRRELAGLIVARLHAAGVPVAGVDRLRLGAPLGVKDLMAALRFAAQPLDDLNLANLLVSPLGGWSQQDLLDHAWRPDKAALWPHLRASKVPQVMDTVARLELLLRLADFETPQAMLQWILVGPWRGRHKLAERLGSEVNDPVDELLNAAHAYAAAHVPSLQGFIRWFDAGEGELKREAGENPELVRVMTVHGSKGLQAPIVILADAVGNPEGRGMGRELALEEYAAGQANGIRIPILPVRKDDRAGRILEADEAAAAEELKEHWRLLYVAMTRAEEALFIGGALLQSEKEPAPNSWYARLAPLFGDDVQADPIWGGVRQLGREAAPLARAPDDAAANPKIDLPQWATQPIGPEPSPPRPLAPSAAGEEQGADPPLPPEAMQQAARRGVLLHRLLERLPDVAREKRSDTARAWLARQADDLAPNAREEILGAALTVLEEPGFADIFGPAALAEVPLAAIVDGQVIAGTADRLLVTPEAVTVVDFKTARRPPASLAEVPESSLRQMAAYAAALAAIYPGREIRAALLYTQAPLLIAIPPAMLAERKPALSTIEQTYPPGILA